MLELSVHMNFAVYNNMFSRPHLEILTTLTLKEDINIFITVYGKETRYTIYMVKCVYICFTVPSVCIIFLKNQTVCYCFLYFVTSWDEILRFKEILK